MVPFEPPLGLRHLHDLLGPDHDRDHRPHHQPADSAGADPLLRRVVVAFDRQVIGFSALHREHWRTAGEWQVDVVVRSDQRRAGVGSALLEDVVDAARRIGVAALLAEADSRRPGNVAFAEHRGFVAFQRFVTMRRSLTDDRELPTVAAPGYRLFAYADTDRGPRARRELYELNRRLSPLIPGNGEQFPTEAAFAREILAANWFRPEGQLIAARGGQWVGLLGLGFDPVSRRASHEFTAVDPGHRGRAVATALKARALRVAMSWGAREVVTGNDASNRAIIAVNRRLGYSTEPGVVRLRWTPSPGP